MMTTIPTTAADFAIWRKAQTFATPSIAQHAVLVQRDMRNIEAMGDRATPIIKRMAAQYRANFEVMLNGNGEG
jgi:hypothetical protein